MTEKQFPLCEALHANASIHCAALVVTENLTKGPGDLLLPAQPSHDLRNGTLTFVKTAGKVYGITCWHVVEHYRTQLRESGNEHSHSMRTMLNGFYIVGDRFIRPEPQYGAPDLDIAIQELNRNFLSAIGKVPIDLDSAGPAPSCIRHGYAVGFPETMKYTKYEDEYRCRVSMPQVEILAEIDGLPSRRFSLSSELATVPAQTDYSGMSGGPIYWSTEDRYGIFGLIYEGGIGNQTVSGNSIYVFGEVATPETIKGWVSQACD